MCSLVEILHYMYKLLFVAVSSFVGLEQCLLMGLWMRFVGMHIWFREFPKPQLKGKAGVTVNIDKVSFIFRFVRY